MRKKITVFSFTLYLLFLAGSCVAQEDSDSLKPVMESRHRLDFSLVYLDSIIDDSLNAQLAYSYSMTPKTNVSVSISYLDARLDKVGGRGIGDTSFVFSWAPTVPITVGPWVPRKLGSGVAVILPTGEASDARSLDATVLAPFLGLVYPVTESLYIYPALTYMGSVDKTITGEDLSIGLVDLGAGWVFNNGIFINAYVAWIKDFETDETYLNTELSLGWSFSTHWSASIDWDTTDYFVPGTIVDVKGRIDGQWGFNLHYNF